MLTCVLLVWGTLCMTNRWKQVVSWHTSTKMFEVCLDLDDLVWMHIIGGNLDQLLNGLMAGDESIRVPWIHWGLPGSRALRCSDEATLS